MMFLITQSTCSDPALASILQVTKKLLLLIQIIVPILLMVMASIHLIRLVKNPDDKKALPKVKNSFLAAAIVFIIPTIVNATMYMLGNQFTLSDCWNMSPSTSSTPSYIDPYGGEKQKVGVTDPSEYQNGKKNVSNSSSSNGNSQQGTQQTSSSGTNGNSQQGTQQTSSSGSNGSSQQGTQQSGKYYPPLEGSSFRISGASQTGGCSNSSGVYHDLSIGVGNKVYAGMDGVAQFIQYTCDGVLYSYGNQVRLTDSTTGTYIIYAHFSKFEGADTPVTKTCHEVYGKSASCGSGACTSGIKKNVVKKKNVKKGELIGYTGNTGNSDGPHLHVEIHENGSSSCVTDPYAAFGMR